MTSTHRAQLIFVFFCNLYFCNCVPTSTDRHVAVAMTRVLRNYCYDQAGGFWKWLLWSGWFEKWLLRSGTSRHQQLSLVHAVGSGWSTKLRMLSHRRRWWHRLESCCKRTRSFIGMMCWRSYSRIQRRRLSVTLLMGSRCLIPGGQPVWPQIGQRPALGFSYCSVIVSVPA